jgi:uncharacterized protein (DUF433 family)
MSDQLLPAIHADAEVVCGMPVFVGSRLPVRTLLACVDAGEDWERLVESWPFLTPAHVEAARRYLEAHPSGK